MFGLKPKIKRKVFAVKHKTNGRIPNAMIIIEKSKTRVFRYVRPKFIPSDSFSKNYDGQWLHILGLDLEGKLWSIVRGSAVEGRMPTDLFMANNCAAEVNDVFGMSIPTIEKIKIGVLVGLCIAIIVVIFLLAAASGGV